MYSIQASPSQLEASRLDFPKTGVRQYTLRYYGTFAGAVSGVEIFIDGVSGKRLQLPPGCAVMVRYDLVAYEFTTATGAFASGVGAVGGVFGATHSAAGTVAAIANPVAATLTPTAQTIATVAVTADNTNKAVQFAITTTGASTTKIVELIVTVAVSNHFPQVLGAIN